MVLGTLSLEKGQTSGCSGCTEIVAYGGGDNVFGLKWSNQWTQWTQYAVSAVDAVDAVHSGCSTQWTQWMQYAVDTVDAVDAVDAVE